MTTLINYVKSVRAAGHQAFTVNDVSTDLGISRNAVICGMYKLKKKGDINRTSVIFEVAQETAYGDPNKS